MIKAVLDTNVVVSALIVRYGKPAQIVAYANARKFQLMLSDYILEETREVLQRRHIQKRFHPAKTDIDRFLEKLSAASLIVSVTNVEIVIPNDPPDNRVLACAVEGGADYLVSGNDHLLDLSEHRGVQVVSPARFLEILDSLPENDG
jgi:putative PIN family toxin of toxin-antitoxin system